MQEFPNILLIDVAQVLAQVQRMMDQVARAVQFVFLFTLVAGLAVLYAAIASTQDERLYQATIMRTLGASRAQINRAHLAEFAVIGAVAGFVAAAGATGAGLLPGEALPAPRLRARSGGVADRHRGRRGRRRARRLSRHAAGAQRRAAQGAALPRLIVL